MESALMMVKLAFDLDMDKPKNFLLRSLYTSGSSPRNPSSPKNMRRTCSSAASSPLSSPMLTRRMAMTKQPSFETGSSIVMNPLTQLPPELAFHIISFLSCKDVLRLAQTSRAGYEYGNDESVWKNLVTQELGLSFLGGSELIFDEHMERRHNRNHNDPSTAKTQDPMELESPAAPSKTWKERFQYLVSIKAELNPVHFRSMKPSRLPVVTTAGGVAQTPSPCGSTDCSGRCAAGQAPASLGCKHYKRDCKLLAACCGRFFVCRHCHDEQVHDHRIDRYATQLVLCMVCNAIQPVGHNCASAQCQNRPLGSYFCGVCKFYDNDPDKAIFHCEHCQVCKLGRKSESFHCHSCGRCFSKAVMATHPCLNKQRQQTTTEER